MSNTPGLISGHFDLLEELGEGSSGSVYRARLNRKVADLAEGTEVAVKYLRRELLSDPEAQSRLEAEGRIGKQIRSDQVVRIYAVESLRLLGMTATYLVMELIRGRSLRQVLIDSGSVVEELARRIGLDAARGLRAVHELGLVHRDIKPENLALTEEGTVKVMDLGLVRRVSRRSANPASGFYGSLSYAAPEVLLGKSARPTSDLYSLGVVLFEVVTGVHPFASAASEPDAIIDAHIKQEPPRPSHFKPRISAFLEQLILDLLAKNPADRPRSAAELVATFERGENSRYWIRHERRAPFLASHRRLRNIQRAADIRFVGRRAEHRELDRHLRSAMDESGRVIFVSGPGGVGRRRMLDEWLHGWLSRRDDIVFLCGEAKGGAGLQRSAPFTEMLLDWFLRGDRPDSPLAQTRLAARIAAEGGLDEMDAQHLAAIIGGEDVSSTPEGRADLLARQILATRAKEQTLVLRIDRTEMLSTTANLIVSRLADEIEKQRVLLILVSLDNRRPDPSMYHLPVHGLPEANFMELADRMFAHGQMPTALIRHAHETLAGSPGNLIDALALLARERKLGGTIGTYRLVADVTDLRPSRSLLDRLRQRLAMLSPEQRFVHLAAAVLGHSFPLSDLVALVGQSELAVLEALSVFQGRIIVTHRGTGRFRHRDFRKEMLKTAPPEARRRLHRIAAWNLEDRDAAPVDVGLHLSRAGEHSSAIPPLLEALERLTATGSRQSSQKISNRLRIHFAALTEAAMPEDRERERQRLRYIMLAGRTHEISDRHDRARASYEAAANLASALGNDQGRARARIAAASLELGHGEFQRVLEHVQSAEAALGGGGGDDLALRARGWSLQARVFGYLGRSEEALQYVRNALDVLPRDAEELRPHLHVDLARLEALRNHFVAALKNLDRAGQLFEARGSGPGNLRVLLHQGHILSMIGSHRQADARLRRAHDRARQLSNVRAQAKARLFLGEMAVWHREEDVAVAHLEAAVDLAMSPGDHVTRLLAGIYLSGLGREPLGLEREVRALGVPALLIGWLLTASKRDGGAELLDEAARLERGVTVPLHLHREMLYASGRGNAARSLEREIAGRLPAGTMRRRFLSFVKR